MHREIAGERELARHKEPELYRPKVRNRINLMTGGRYTPGLFLCPFGYRQSASMLALLRSLYREHSSLNAFRKITLASK